MESDSSKFFVKQQIILQVLPKDRSTSTLIQTNESLFTKAKEKNDSALQIDNYMTSLMYANITTFINAFLEMIQICIYIFIYIYIYI